MSQSVRARVGRARHGARGSVHDGPGHPRVEPAAPAPEQQRGRRAVRGPAPVGRAPASGAARWRPAPRRRRCAPGRPCRARAARAGRRRRRRGRASTARRPEPRWRRAAPAPAGRAAPPGRPRRRPEPAASSSAEASSTSSTTGSAGRGRGETSRAPGSVSRCPVRRAHAVKVRAAAARRARVERLAPAACPAASQRRSAAQVEPAEVVEAGEQAGQIAAVGAHGVSGPAALQLQVPQERLQGRRRRRARGRRAGPPCDGAARGRSSTTARVELPAARDARGVVAPEPPALSPPAESAPATEAATAAGPVPPRRRRPAGRMPRSHTSRPARCQRPPRCSTRPRRSSSTRADPDRTDRHAGLHGQPAGLARGPGGQRVVHPGRGRVQAVGGPARSPVAARGPGRSRSGRRSPAPPRPG